MTVNVEIYYAVVYYLLVVLKLLLAFQAKHLLADYFWQNEYMLQKFKPDWGFFLPLCAHAGIHALCTFTILYMFIPVGVSFILSLTVFDFIVHFFMDRIKAGPKYLGRYKPLTSDEYRYYKNIQSQLNSPDDFLHSQAKIAPKLIRGNTYFWRALGLDQAVHHITHYAVIYAVVFKLLDLDLQLN